MISYHSTSEDNIVRHNISYNFAFGSNSIFHISQDIRVTYNFCYFDHFFGHISRSTGPILLTWKTILSAIKFPIILVIIIFSVSVIFLEIFSKNFSGTPIWPLFCPYLPNHLSDLAQIVIVSHTNDSTHLKKIIKIGSDLLELPCGQTDRQTFSFFTDSAYWATDRGSAPTLASRIEMLHDNGKPIRPVYFVRV